MEKEYIFVCIGTNKIISDSFGPRVGDKLQKIFYLEPNIEVIGTMNSPIHLKNASDFIKTINNKEKMVILIDSAFAINENIGNTYVSFGGIEIGKAFGKSIYFPANISIKTVIANKNKTPIWSINQIEFLATDVATKIKKIVYEL